eukprot:6865622-Pyramimonas_sp.AAC.1
MGASSSAGAAGGSSCMGAGQAAIGAGRSSCVTGSCCVGGASIRARASASMAFRFRVCQRMLMAAARRLTSGTYSLSLRRWSSNAAAAWQKAPHLS